MSVQREAFSSRLGFILAAAGSAIGLGAIWKFPYLAGANGGGAFLIIYLAVVLFIGLTMMLAETSLGRATRTDAVGAFRDLGGRRWSLFGYTSILAAFLILSFYCVVGGWTVGYLVKALSGTLLDPPQHDFKAQFDRFTGDAAISLGYFLVFMALTVGIIVGGIAKGIERLNKVLMPLLFLLMIIMIARSVTLPGAMDGVRFLLGLAPDQAAAVSENGKTLLESMLVFDFSHITSGVLIDVLGFACFSLSLGFAGLLTYGSYMRPEDGLIRSTVWVIVLQTLCCVMASFMVIPAVFAFGMEPSIGPGLTYVTLPAVFSAMPGGQSFAVLFFLLFLMAALTSSVSILEPIVTWLIDQFRLSRRVAGMGVAVASSLLGVSACWSFGAVDWTFGLEGLPAALYTTPFNVLDTLTLKIMMPVNVLATCVLMGWIADDTFRRQLFPTWRGKGTRLPFWPDLSWRYTDWTARIVAPAVIVVILVASF